MRDYILERDCFSRQKLADQIGMTVQNLNAWLRGVQSLSEEKRTKLEGILHLYGYDPEKNSKTLSRISQVLI